MFVFGPTLLQRIVSIGGSLAIAAFIGFFMQMSAGAHSTATHAIATPETIAPQVTPVETPVAAPVESVVFAAATPEVDEFLTTPALTSKLQAASSNDIIENKPVLDCAINLVAAAGAAALVDVIANAPCYSGELATVHHEGMMFNIALDDDGKATFKVPALKVETVIMVSFASGRSKTVEVETPSLKFYDRVVLQWQGDMGLQFHAFEYGAAYNEAGHVWSGTPQKVSTAAAGDGGFLLSFGAANGLKAEVYTFPSGISRKVGNIEMTVEAEISADNCARAVDAQTLQFSALEGLAISDLSLDIPGCDTIGEFLVLNNLVETMTLAHN